jgi:hypothetical protein
MDHQQIVSDEIDRALNALFPYGDGSTSRNLVEYELRKIGEVAFHEGTASALLSLQTVEDAATTLGVSPRRVRTLAAVAHDRWSIGRQIARGVWLFTPDEVEQLRPGKPGRPKKS